MWNSQFEQIDAQTRKTFLSNDGEPLAYREVVRLWQDDAAFRDYFITMLCACPFEAFFWETPVVTLQSCDRVFEFVVSEAPALAQLQPDSSAFQPQFTAQKSEDVLTFPNLGGDAWLIVPAPIAEAHCYTHLATFLRSAPRAQIEAFWICAGQAMDKRVGNTPTWLSTSGLGVPWLHLRLDTRPKYYRYAPYKTASTGTH